MIETAYGIYWGMLSVYINIIQCVLKSVGYKIIIYTCIYGSMRSDTGDLWATRGLAYQNSMCNLQSALWIRSSASRVQPAVKRAAPQYIFSEKSLNVRGPGISKPYCSRVNWIWMDLFKHTHIFPYGIYRKFIWVNIRLTHTECLPYAEHCSKNSIIYEHV